MTVVVAGFDYSSMRKWSYDENWDNLALSATDKAPVIDEPVPSRQDVQAELANEIPSLAFLVADSVLSTKSPNRLNRALSSQQERKIREVDIDISIPCFTPDGHVTSRNEVATTYSCGIAYAGSTFTFNQVLSKFQLLCRNLVYTWDCKAKNYQIVEGDSPLALRPRSDQSFDEEIDFAARDLPLLDGKFVASLLERSICETIDDVFTLFSEQQNDDPLKFHAEFALAVHCQASGRPRLFHLNIVDDRSCFPSWFKVDVREMANHELLVLGKPSWLPDFEHVQAQAVRDNASIYSAVLELCESLVRADEKNNFVGGAINCGYVERNRFVSGQPKVF